MRRLDLLGLAIVSAALAGCHATAAHIIQTRTEIVPLDSVTPRTRLDSMRIAALSRADSAAARVDTIIVAPASLELHVGDSVPFFQTLKVEGRDRSGERVMWFAPTFNAIPRSLLQFRGQYLIAVAPGSAYLSVSAVHRSVTDVNALPRPTTLVPITIVAP